VIGAKIGKVKDLSITMSIDLSIIMSIFAANYKAAERVGLQLGII
jgi:hypothetical protein